MSAARRTPLLNAVSAALWGRAALLLALAWAFVAPPRPARAAFEDLGAGARAPGMGNDFTDVADDAYAVFYNPAGLTELRSPEFSAAYTRLFLGLSDNSNLGLSQFVYAQPLKRGQWGHLGLAWQRFALDGTYAEQSLYLSYAGRPLWQSPRAVLDWGVNIKNLSRSFTPPPEAFNAKGPGLNFGAGVDPVLAGNNSMSALDADAGFMLRTSERITAGLMITHLLEPSVGFADSSDTLGRGYKLGFGYKRLWTNLASDFQFTRAPDGSLDKTAIVAAERYFPSLNHGQFALRGSLGIGSREYRQATLGFSYRISALQADYAFMLPFGTIQGTNGTHRIGLTYHFGAPRPEDEYAAELLDKLRTTERDPLAGYAYEFEGLKRLPASDQVLAAMIRAHLEAGRYTKAQEYLLQMVNSKDPAIKDLRDRLAAVIPIYPSFTERKLKWEQTVAQGVGDWLDGRTLLSAKRLAYAQSLKPDDLQIEEMLGLVEAALGRKVERVSPKWVGKLSMVEEKLLRAQVALRQRHFGEALALGRDVLELEPGNPTALSRVGTAQYLLGHPAEALGAWSQALQFERNADERAVLARAVRQARDDVARLQAEGKTSIQMPPPIATAPQAAAPIDPREIERLYRSGVELYAAGDNVQASDMFRRILEIDPENAQALKALKRLKVEP